MVLEIICISESPDKPGTIGATGCGVLEFAWVPTLLFAKGLGVFSFIF
jgi:hypothetical protein